MDIERTPSFVRKTVADKTILAQVPKNVWITHHALGKIFVPDTKQWPDLILGQKIPVFDLATKLHWLLPSERVSRSLQPPTEAQVWKFSYLPLGATFRHKNGEEVYMKGQLHAGLERPVCVHLRTGLFYSILPEKEVVLCDARVKWAGDK